MRRGQCTFRLDNKEDRHTCCHPPSHTYITRVHCTICYVGGNQTEGADVTELVVDSENVVIRLPGRDHVVAELRRRNTALSTCGRESLQLEEDDDGRVLGVSLPEFTEYLLDVFEPRAGGGLEHIQTYAISRVPAADDGDADARSRDARSTASAAEADEPAMDDKEREKLAEKKAVGA